MDSGLIYAGIAVLILIVAIVAVVAGVLLRRRGAPVIVQRPVAAPAAQVPAAQVPDAGLPSKSRFQILRLAACIGCGPAWPARTMQ